MDPLLENRARWDELVAHHVRSDFYDVPAFLAGANTLLPIERPLLGDLTGQTLLHLQCHFGLDTLSCARLGAQVTGLDFSAKAVAAARDLAKQAGIDARFVEANVLRAAEALGGETFDVVFTSWGVLGWLPDLRAWARNVAACLQPGGRLVLAEIHPVAWVFDGGDGLQQTWPYFGDGQRFDDESSGSYAAGDDAGLVHTRSHFWLFELGQTVQALLDQGLRLTHLAEHRETCCSVAPGMTKGADGLWRLPDTMPNRPLSFSLVAEKPR